MKETEVYELCPHCGLEAHLFRDIEADGYKAYCPHCGGRLMLCDECMHGQGYCCGGCDYDSETDSCKHNPTKPDAESKLTMTAREKAKLEFTLRKSIEDYNRCARAYNKCYKEAYEWRAQKRRRYLEGIVDCLKALGYTTGLEFTDITMYAEIKQYAVGNTDGVLFEDSM
jgi:hypothetical protein